VIAMTERSIPAPTQSPESEPFYAAAKEGKFTIRRCKSCGKAHWYPRANCPFCWGETAWETASGDGTIYSYSPMRRANYTIAYVTLKEGPTMLTNIVGCDPDTLSVGQAVKIKWTAAEDGTPVPTFTPA
jgi:uncharacterized OB-fold protein